MITAPWQIALSDGRIFSQVAWTEIDKFERRRMLIEHKGSRFEYISPSPVCSRGVL